MIYFSKISCDRMDVRLLNDINKMQDEIAQVQYQVVLHTSSYFLETHQCGQHIFYLSFPWVFSQSTRCLSSKFLSPGLSWPSGQGLPGASSSSALANKTHKSEDWDLLSCFLDISSWTQLCSNISETCAEFKFHSGSLYQPAPLLPSLKISMLCWVASTRYCGL